MNVDYPKRKHVRLKNYDYSRNGIYFVTICTQNRRCILSQIVLPRVVGAEMVGRGLAPAASRLTACGRLVEEELTALMVRYPSVWIEKYVIMPNHIHALICLQEDTAGASPRPTLMQVLGTLKSLTTRRWNGMIEQPGAKLWQSGYHDHIIRDDNDFLNHWSYLNNNPARWAEDEYYVCTTKGTGTTWAFLKRSKRG